MEQNNFEKKIQQKLGELKIPPSDAVWEHIEKHINGRKDRKKIILLFLVFISLASGGYYILNSIANDTKSKNQLETAIVETGSKQTKKEDSSFNKTTISPGNDSEKDSASGVNSTTHKTQFQKIEHNKIERRTTNTFTTIKDRNLAVDSKNGNNKETGTVDDNKNLPANKQTLPDGRQANSQKNELDINSSAKGQEKNTSIVVAGIENIPGKNEASHNEMVIQNEKMADGISADSSRDLSQKTRVSSKKSKRNQQNQKWKIGVTFSGGTSMIGGGGKSATPNLSSFANMDFISVASPANNYSLSSFSNYFTPSSMKNSMAFIAGIFIEKNISRKNKLDLGISYKYYSLTNTTGNKIDFNIAPSLSTENLYSSWSNSNTYRNNFHYIEIPVSLKFQLGHSESLPIYWSVGMNVSQLIASNSLQFKSSPGLYYNDNSFYNKTQFGLHTGFSALLFAKAKVPVDIGPYFIYNTSRMADDGLYGGKHFSFIGIKAGILLGKK